MVVSHRPEHKMSGKLHDETNYGTPYRSNGKTMVHIRKSVAGLSSKDIQSIVDPAVRLAVEQRANSLDGDLTKCESANEWPTLQSKDGRLIPIKRVRVRKAMNPTPIASGVRQRYVALSSNHHTTIFAELDQSGREIRWESIPVSLFEAMERKRQHLPIVERRHPDMGEYQFKFSLMNGDIVEICKDGNPELFRLRSIESDGGLFLLSIRDARLLKEINASGDRWRPSAEALRKLNCRKVVIDTLGRVHPAND
jgi:CRISPR-associated endonuclease Csn1